jgi:hypothetical protein
MKRNICWLGYLLIVLAAFSLAQQSGGEQLAVRTATLPVAKLQQFYRFALQADGGVLPRRWLLVSGDLPPGIKLASDGVLNGTPTATGQFSFVVAVQDSAKPESEREQSLTLRVVTPLLVEWSRPPAVNGQRVEGAIKVSNSTDQDFDLTVVIVAVNEIGRATALGYQHFKLKREVTEYEIPFGENLPFGAYDINVDVVGEVPEANAIYRARLAPQEKIQVKQGP